MSKVWIGDKEGEKMTNILGFTGAALLALCALPEVISSVRKGYCGASSGLLFVWLLGEILTLVYVFITNPDVYLLFNYSSNVILILVLVYYKTKPMRPDKLKTLNFVGVKELRE